MRFFVTGLVVNMEKELNLYIERMESNNCDIAIDKGTCTLTDVKVCLSFQTLIYINRMNAHSNPFLPL